MKLSDLVRYLNRLDQQEKPDPDRICQQYLGDLLRIVDTNQPFLQDHSSRLQDFYQQTRHDLAQFQQQISAVRQDLLNMIATMQPAYFAASYKLHDTGMVNDSDDHILRRVPVLTESVQLYLQARIQARGDWQHAGMVIRPGLGEWLPLLVGCDPLYLVDIRSSLLDHSMTQFSLEYQRRLRRYTLRENDAAGRVLGDLPEAQFGFCLALNFFHYKPFELIRLYLTDIYRKLKPGGVLAITFNDCDRAGGVDLAERHFMCYTPGSMLVALSESLGFEVKQRYLIDSSNTWMEMQRPGKLTSNRGGQSLAKIVANH